MFFVGTRDIQFLKVAINLCMGYSLWRVEMMVILYRVRPLLSLVSSKITKVKQIKPKTNNIKARLILQRTPIQTSSYKLLKRPPFCAELNVYSYGFIRVLRGLLPRRKPELQCVLEQKWREKQKQRELLLSAPSDLEAKLRQRRQKIQAVSNVCTMQRYIQFFVCGQTEGGNVKTGACAVLQFELEQKKRSEGAQNVPEFVRVRGTLRRVQTFS